MISCTRMAKRYTSFWKALIPGGKTLVRTINLNLEEHADPLSSESDVARRGLISDIGLFTLKESIERNLTIDELIRSKKVLHHVSNKAWEKKQRFVRTESSKNPPPNDDEISEAINIARRLNQFIQENETGKGIIPFPIFPGCGILDTGTGDLLAETTLYEIKARGERAFRLIDIKQVLLYLALNHEFRSYEINHVILLNPRMGTNIHKLKENELAYNLSGRSSVELYSDIIEFVSSGDASR